MSTVESWARELGGALAAQGTRLAAAGLLAASCVRLEPIGPFELLLCGPGAEAVEHELDRFLPADARTFLGFTVYDERPTDPCLRAHEAVHRRDQVLYGTWFYFDYVRQFVACAQDVAARAWENRESAKDAVRSCYLDITWERDAHEAQAACERERDGGEQ